MRSLAVMAAMMMACGSDDTTAPAPRDLIRFAPSLRAAPADGEAVLSLTAVLSSESHIAPRLVTFTTSAGLFQPANANHVAISVDSGGVAVVLLQAPATPGVAIVRAAAGNVILRDSIVFTPAPPDLVNLVIGSHELPADGASTTGLSATIPAPYLLTHKQVTFATTVGNVTTSASGAVGTDIAGTAVTLLRASTTIGTAIVRASATRTMLQDSVRFVRAFADTLILDADPPAVSAGATSSLTIKASLRRATGVATPGGIVSFSQPVAGGQAIGSLGAASVSDDAGNVQVRFYPGVTPYRGPVTVSATTAGSAGRVLSATLTLQIY